MSEYIKPGVCCEGIQLETLHAILVCHACYIDAGQHFTVTSINDGVHSKNSLHYEGLAIDLRTRDFIGITAQKMAELIAARLGPDYDVVAEKDHIHVEYDPR